MSGKTILNSESSPSSSGALNGSRNSVYTHSFHFYVVTGVHRLVELLNADIRFLTRRHLDQSTPGTATGGVHDNRRRHNLRADEILLFISFGIMKFPAKDLFIHMLYVASV